LYILAEMGLQKNTQSQEKKSASEHAEKLIATLNYFHPLSNEIKNYLIKHSHPCSFRRGKYLLKTGEICKHVYFISKGAVRGFIKENKRDIVTWITAENEMVTSISGLDRNEPSIENMQAIENCEMLSLTFADLQNLYIQFPEFNIVTRKLLQQYYRDAEGRAFIARLTNAKNKYKYFLTKFEHLVNRVPLKHIASFLGITLETLSRLRRKLAEEDNLKK
jgi:CRP-like cAMP-binding protein